jgi:hypothetical protein
VFIYQIFKLSLYAPYGPANPNDNTDPRIEPRAMDLIRDELMKMAKDSEERIKGGLK